MFTRSFVRCEHWASLVCLVAMRMRRFQLCVVLCQTILLSLTWPLWMARPSPPVLPMVELAAFATSIGPVLVLTLVIALVRPPIGAVLHGLVLLIAIAADQTRLQPSVVSLALLLVLSSFSPSSSTVLIARIHLCSLWLWAGIHKLLSPAFAATTFPWLVTRAWPSAPEFLLSQGGTIFALAEGGLGLLALASIPGSGRMGRIMRQVVGYYALVLHLGIVTTLALLGENRSMIPWNVALACSGFALFGSPDNGVSKSPRRTTHSLSAAALSCFLMISPAGFYAGVTDAYLAHVLYTGAVITSVRCDANGICITALEQKQSMSHLDISFPPEERMFKAHFKSSCRRGERLILHPPRTRLHPNLDIKIIPCFENTISSGGTP